MTDSSRAGHRQRSAWALARLREAGHRNTRPRKLVLDVVARAGGHLTAEAVHQHASVGGRLDLSTVYRTLALFERLRIVHTLVIGGRITYGLADHPHAHTVCDVCGRVQALRSGEWAAALSSLVQQGIEGFAPSRIIIRGHCDTCRDPARTASAAEPADAGGPIG